MTLEDLEKLLAEYAALVEAGQDRASGWPSSINVVSKIGQVAAVRIMARDYQDEARRRGLLINAACPGLVETEASRPWFDDMSSAQSPDATAVDVAWLATRPAGVTEPVRRAGAAPRRARLRRAVTGQGSGHGPFDPLLVSF
ncbi:MAG TPA: hypothetical protein VIL16_31385 [Trebonia sp.]